MKKMNNLYTIFISVRPNYDRLCNYKSLIITQSSPPPPPPPLSVGDVNQHQYQPTTPVRKSVLRKKYFKIRNFIITTAYGVLVFKCWFLGI